MTSFCHLTCHPLVQSLVDGRGGQIYYTDKNNFKNSDFYGWLLTWEKRHLHEVLTTRQKVRNPVLELGNLRVQRDLGHTQTAGGEKRSFVAERERVDP